MATPSDTGHKWLAAGALIAVAVGVSFASNAFKKHLKSALPEAAPTERSPMVSSPPPTPAPTLLGAAPGADDAPPANDPRTPPFGTPKSSAAARPEWASFETSRKGEEIALRYAPFHSRAAQLFAMTPTSNDDLSRAFVVCRGSVTDDTTDVHLRVTFGNMPMVVSDRREQYERTYVTAPLVDVKKGQLVDATLFARRATGLVPLVQLKAKLGEDDLSKEDEAGAIECVALDGDALQDRIAKDAGRADAAIARRAALRIDAKKAFELDPNNELTVAQRSIADLAALTGWVDPRVKARLAANEAASAKNWVEERRAFDELHRDARSATAQKKVVFNVERMSCTPQKCDLTLVVENLGDSAFALDLDMVTINLLVDRKDRIDAEQVEEIERVVVAPGERRKVTLRGQAGLNAAQSLAQICIGEADVPSCGVIRLH